jgi:hypothetical protein
LRISVLEKSFFRDISANRMGKLRGSSAYKTKLRPKFRDTVLWIALFDGFQWKASSEFAQRRILKKNCWGK